MHTHTHVYDELYTNKIKIIIIKITDKKKKRDEEKWYYKKELLY